MTEVLVLNGPNLNLLGMREPEIYGTTTLSQLEEACVEFGTDLGLNVQCAQSNVEGELVSIVQEAGLNGQWIVFNPGAYTHTSIALRDAISGSDCQVIEVHISNIHSREEFRHHSMISAVAKGSIVGLGLEGYKLALQAIHDQTEGV